MFKRVVHFILFLALIFVSASHVNSQDGIPGAGAPADEAGAQARPDRQQWKKAVAVPYTPNPVAQPVVTSAAQCAQFENYAGAIPAGFIEFCTEHTTQPSDTKPLGPNDLAYALDLYNGQFVVHELGDFSGQTPLANSTEPLYGLDFNAAATVLYAIRDDGMLGTINQSTGVFSPIGDTGTGDPNTPSGLTIDPVTNAAYFSTIDSTGSVVYRLYSVNLNTAAATLIGSSASTPYMIDIAISPTGQMYGHDISTDAIYQINRNNGSVTYIGPTGISANFAQGMDFDNTTGTLYAYVLEDSGGSYHSRYGTINLSTGQLTSLTVDNPFGEFEGATKTVAITTSTISGHVADNNGVAMANVVISYSGGSASTNASGNYTISNLNAGTYTLTPSKSGYTFSPASRSVTVPPNKTGQNFTGTPLGGGDEWSFSGPRYAGVNSDTLPDAPHVIQVVLHPTNPNVVYAATNQGVYRSSNGGETWQPRNEGLGGYGDLVVTGLAINPNNPQVLYISTWGLGLLKSTDGGFSWQRLADPLTNAPVAALADGSAPPGVAGGGPSYSFDPTTGRAQTVAPTAPIQWDRTAVRRVVLHPNNPSEIYACIDDGEGLYRSTNGGATWAKITLGSGSARTYTFAPSNPSIRYASFGSWDSSGGFYRTTNGGGSWTPVGGGTINGTVTAVAIHPNNPNIVLAAATDGLYRTINGGSSWGLVATDPGETFFSVAFARSNPNIAYAGGYVWVYRSSNTGGSWDVADNSYPAFYQEGLAIHPNQPDTVYVGSNDFETGGVYKRTGSGAAFALKANGMRDTFVLDLEKDPTQGSTIYASTWGAGGWRSTNGGDSWQWMADLPPYLYDIKAIPSSGNTVLYAATFYSDWNFFKSTDHGASWIEMDWDGASSSYISFAFERPYSYNPNYIVAATFRGLEYSTNGGVSWTKGTGPDGIILSVCAFPAGQLLAATYGGGIYYSGNGGASWAERNNGLTNYEVYTYDVVCSPDTPGLAYTGSLGVHRTTNYGSTWTASPGLEFDYVRALALVPGTGDVFAGSNQNGVFYRPASETIWFPINAGLSERRIRSLLLYTNSPLHLFAGTNGSGAWDYTMTIFALFKVSLPAMMVPQ